MNPYAHLYPALEADLDAVLRRETGVLPRSAAAWVREMLDHGEHGLAWDELKRHEREFTAESRARMRDLEVRMGLVEDERSLHQRALALREGPEALALWIDLAAQGNPDAPERLRVYARCDDPALRDPARDALSEMELSHEDPMP